MILEVCIDLIESALAAMRGGADRIEVCGALSVGGITPSYGLVEQCVAIGGIEVMMMIRPHAGGFCYEPDEVSIMLRDIHVAQTLGAHGIVIGALQKDGRVDRELCQRLIDSARPLSVTYHRAFDLTPDPLEALDSLLELGVNRLLTSGQAECAMQGSDLIRELVGRAGNGLAVMAGAGIRPQDVATLIRTTGVREIHTSARESVADDNSRMAEFVQPSSVTRQEIVREMVQAIRDFEP
jgi:copper homeostasis protein